MSYTLITGKTRRGHRIDNMISVTKSYIAFLANFKEKYGIEDYAQLYTNDEGYLCFKFVDKGCPNSYKVTTLTSSSSFIPMPAMLRDGILPLGAYDVEEKDGYFVTDCKLNLE